MNIRKAICSVLAALLIIAASSAFATGGGDPSASPEQTAAPTASVSTTKGTLFMVHSRALALSDSNADANANAYTLPHPRRAGDHQEPGKRER